MSVAIEQSPILGKIGPWTILERGDSRFGTYEVLADEQGLHYRLCHTPELGLYAGVSELYRCDKHGGATHPVPLYETRGEGHKLAMRAFLVAPMAPGSRYGGFVVAGPVELTAQSACVNRLLRTHSSAWLVRCDDGRHFRLSEQRHRDGVPRKAALSLADEQGRAISLHASTEDTAARWILARLGMERDPAYRSQERF